MEELTKIINDKVEPAPGPTFSVTFPTSPLPFQHSRLCSKNVKCLDWGLAKTESYLYFCVILSQ